MEERLALQVSSLAELEKQLQTYVSDSVHEEGNWYRGRVKQHDVINTFAADEDGQKAIAAWMNKRKYGKLLELWVKGLTIDWKHLYTAEAESARGTGQGLSPALPRRISLPTYPFARERYWIPATTVETGQGTLVAQGTQATGNGNALNKLNKVALSDLSTEIVGTAPSASPVATDMQMTSSVTNGRHLSPTIQARRQVEEELVRSLAEALYLEEGDIDVEIPFGDMGLDSVIGVEWIQSINKQYASNLAAKCVYDYPTIRQLASFLEEDLLKHRHTTIQSVPTLSLDDLLQQVQQGILNAKEANLLLTPALALDSYLIQVEHSTSQKEDCR
jgi:polyketide synthase PksL